MMIAEINEIRTLLNRLKVKLVCFRKKYRIEDFAIEKTEETLWLRVNRYQDLATGKIIEQKKEAVGAASKGL